MRRLTAPFALVALLALAPGVGAQSEDPLPDPDEIQETTPAPKVKPKAGKLTLTFRNGLRREGKVYLAKGQRVKIRGRARPFVSGQYVRIEFRRKGRTVATRVRRLRKA